MTRRPPSSIRASPRSPWRRSLVFAAAAVSAGPAQFVIVNINAPGVGFNDPTPAAPVGGNTGTTLGEQRLIAFHTRPASGARGSTAPCRSASARSSRRSAPDVLGSAGRVYVVARLSRTRRCPAPGITSRWRTSSPASTCSPAQRRHQRELQHQLQLLPRPRQQPRRRRTISSPCCCTSSRTASASARWRSLTTGALLGGFPDHYNSKLLDTTLGLYWPQMTNAQRLASATRFGRVVWDGAA